MPTLLVVDDEPNVLYSLQTSLESDTLRVVTAATARRGLSLLEEHKPDAVLLDMRLPDMSGLDAFTEIHKTDAHLPVIMMTAFATTEAAIEAMKRGAFEYLIKPIDLRQVRGAVAKAIQLRQMLMQPAQQAAVQPQDFAEDEIVGRSAAMQEVYKAIGRVAPTDVNVLILGESGTGKELVARAIHRHSRRANRPFLAINCAAIPESLLESELFGHERGAFTGAERKRIGKFERADGGTIFLDEIGDMSGATQAKMLRILQDQRFERVGGNETIQSDTRVLAATNQDLEELAAAGRFRRDLYYRLKVYAIRTPPLRERMDDLPPLVDHFIRHFNAEVGKSVRAASPETIALLQRYPWPGNVRELQGVVKNMLVNATDELLTPDCLPAGFSQDLELSRRVLSAEGDRLDLAQLVGELLESGGEDIYRKVILAVDRLVLEETLRSVNHNQVEAARRLGISRTTLRAKLSVLADRTKS